MNLKYLKHYPDNIKNQVIDLIKTETLHSYLKSKYPNSNTITTDKALYDYVLNIKNSFMKKSKPISKVYYDGKIKDLSKALGSHTFVSRIQGSKLKAKNEIRVATIFRSAPEEFLKMIVIHELAHFKEKEHNRAFYKLCMHMDPSYHQFEFDTRVYLTYLDFLKKS